MGENTLFALRDINPPVNIPINSMNANQVLDSLIDIDKARAFCDARKARLLARFAELREPERAGTDLADGAPEEVALELAMNPHTAAVHISRARDLVTRLPATTDALEAGEIDYVRAKAMNDLTSVLTEEQARRVESKVLAFGKRANPSRFRHSVRYHVIAVDPSAAERLRRTAKADRDVTGRDLSDGMGQLAITLEPHEAQAAYDQINMLANKVKTPDRTLAQCRADVFLDLVLGKNNERVRVNLNVTVPMSTLLGLTRLPGEISGYGPITAEYASELAQDAMWRRVITDEHGQVLEVSRRRYASAALARHIRLRDRTCRQPGCGRTADRSEIDHTVRYADGGVTSVDNTNALCRKHNLMRERSDWGMTQPLPGTLVFRTPANRVHTTTPELYEPAPF
ncbi:hypothetical protein JOF56_006753 [Kibdelosporangium banguiense]|uniref:HNH nuclease domain-containing protein n=1 Tax=Kibdelosporangium banguiense TaxID=1365924 RepID=A0ABS4TPN6_9PSEU|nr:HNH endonuclease signature motif containing protein [Kibdelosporangium banguiense]MBP2326368.1 hypothetical protein [Kibdelosporangium banguiense]